MKINVLLSLILALMSLNVFAKSNEFKFDTEAAWQNIKQDYNNFYRSDRLWRAAKFYAAGAVMAHTNLDTDFQEWHQDKIHSSTSDDFAGFAKLFGEKILLVPISMAASSMQFFDAESRVGRWGENTMRAYLVGGPAMFSVQLLTGGSRPSDKYQDAKWRPFNDDNGVSGHAFVGAVPFLTLAQDPGLEPWQKGLAYFGSTLSAWSRINDDKHFLSQAMLGWYMAWESVDAVHETGKHNSWFSFQPYSYGDGVGLAFVATW